MGKADAEREFEVEFVEAEDAVEPRVMEARECIGAKKEEDGLSKGESVH